MKHNKRAIFSDIYNLPLLTVPAESLLQDTTAAPFFRTVAGCGRASPTHHPNYSEDTGGELPVRALAGLILPRSFCWSSSVGEGGCDAGFSSCSSFFSTWCFLRATFHRVKVCACFGFTSRTELCICCNPAVRDYWQCSQQNVQYSLQLQKPFLYLKCVWYR